MSAAPIPYDEDELKRTMIAAPPPWQQPVNLPPVQAPPTQLDSRSAAEPKQQSQPQIAAPAAEPQAQSIAPRGTLQGDKDEEARLKQTGSGESQISQKIQGTSLGQNHPILGKILGGAAQGIATLGDVGLSAVAPSLAINLPGTAYHHQMLLNQQGRQVAQDEANQESEAKTAEENAKATAQPGENDKPLLTNEGYGTVDSKSGEFKPLKGPSGNVLQSPEKADKFTIHDTPDGPIRVDDTTGEAHYISADGQKVGPKVDTEVTKLEVGGKEHSIIVNKKTGEIIKDLGPTGERAPTVHVDTGTHNLWSVPQPDGSLKAVEIKAGAIIPKGAVSLSGQNSENVSGDKAAKADEKASANLDNELNLMKQFAANPSPTNDAAMLMHYIGATKPESMGKIRLNDRELKLFGGTRSSIGDAEALLTKVANGQSLTPKQRTDMVNTMTMIDQAAKRSGGPTAKEGDTKQNSHGDKVIYKNGKWEPA